MTEYGYVHQARVISYDAARDAYNLESVALARGSRWNSVPSCRPGLIAGDRVIVVALGTSRDNLVIVGKPGEDFPDIGDIPGLTAALAALTAADVALDGRLDTAEGALVVLDGRLDTAESTLVSLDGRLDTAEATIITHTSDIATNASDLTTHAATLGLHGGVLPVANLAARDALTGNYDGRIIYRLDRDWVEIHDGTAWRVQGVAICSGTSDLTTNVTHPYEGQKAYQTDTKAYYQYTGGGWRPMSGYGGRWTQTSAQSIPNGADTKVTFNNQLDTPIGLSYSAGEFTIAQPGKWDLNWTLVYPWTASLEMWAWIGPVTTPTTTRWDLDTRIAPSALGPPQPLRCHIARSFPSVGDKFSLWTWHSSGTAKALANLYGGVIHFEATWLGPA